VPAVAGVIENETSFLLRGLGCPQSVSYCIKRSEGTIVREGKVPAQRQELMEWAQSLGDGPWCGGLEATICSHWIYHLLRPYVAELKMAHPARLKAITAAKRKTDCLDATYARRFVAL
jgi:hypothetical protein